MTIHRILNADARDMRETPDASVHLVVTSPPYWQLKDYGHKGQIGYDQPFAQYINHLNLVWSECVRALHPGCRLCINAGDQFARAIYYGRYKVIPIHAEIIKFCEAAGMDYMGAIIWRKVTTCHTTGGAAVMGSFPYPRNGILKLDFEYIMIFKKPGEGPKVSDAVKKSSAMTTEEWNTFFAGHWNFLGERRHSHLAPFPVELPSRLIRMYSFPGETILDPFLGSGTTAVAALKLGRDSIGYEIVPEFAETARKRLESEKGFFDQDVKIAFSRRATGKINWNEKMRNLPGLFTERAPMKRDKATKHLRFGSTISTADAAPKKKRGRPRKIK